MWSARDMIKLYPQAGPAATQMMVTDTVGLLFPDFTEEYGKNKKLDIVFSPSHSLFVDGVPDAKPSGVYMDKNGNWKAQINLPIQVNVEKGSSWEPVRNIYMQVIVRGLMKFNQNTDEENADMLRRAQAAG